MHRLLATITKTRISYIAVIAMFVQLFGIVSCVDCRAANPETPGTASGQTQQTNPAYELRPAIRADKDDFLKDNAIPTFSDGVPADPHFKDPFAAGEAASSVSMAPLRLSSSLQISSFQPLVPEGSFDQMISLREALDYAMENSLPIRISKATYEYQRYQFWGNVASALPNIGASYTLTKSKVLPDTKSLARNFTPRMSLPVFQGGSVFYGALSQYYRTKGWKESLNATVNESLLDVYQKYATLVLNRSLLKIRAKSLEVSREQLDLNNKLYRAGTGTRFAIMQSRTQLAQDQQALLQQQVLVRQSSLALSYSLNAPMAVNFIPVEDTISERYLLQNATNIDRLIQTAIKFRPDLKQYELFKLSAARNVQVASSVLYPNATFFLLYSYSNTTQNQSRAKENAGGGIGDTAGAGVFGGKFNTFEGGFALTQSLPGFGLVGAANIAGAQVLNKQALMQANQELQLVMQQVRGDYVNWLSAKQQIEATVYGTASAGEALRLAEVRVKTGIGTNLELIQAQRDYINALTSEAQAIINSNIAQALLQRDIGVISIESLTRGYKVAAEPLKQSSSGRNP